MKKSIVFAIVLAVSTLIIAPAIAVETNSPNIYTDSDTGLTFTIPDGWEQSEFVTDVEVSKAKFACKEDRTKIITYTSKDLFKELSESEKELINRADLNMSQLTLLDFAEMLETSIDNVEEVTYNGRRYFKTEMEDTKEVNGITLKSKVIQVMHIDNGWAYYFGVCGANAIPEYTKLEELIRSVKYPSYSAEDYLNANYRGYDYEEKGNVLALILPIMVILAVFVVVNIVRNKKKRPQKQGIVCPKCGEILPQSSSFCHICGERIVKGNTE